MALSHLTSLKGLHLVNLNEPKMCVSTMVQNYISEAVLNRSWNCHMCLCIILHTAHVGYLTTMFHQLCRKQTS